MDMDAGETDVYNANEVQEIMEMIGLDDDSTSSWTTSDSTIISGSLSHNGLTLTAASSLFYGPDYETPKVKKALKVVRRRLFSPSPEEDATATLRLHDHLGVNKENIIARDEKGIIEIVSVKTTDESRISQGSNQANSPVKITEFKGKQSIDNVAPQSSSRKIAQLVVWTKPSGKQSKIEKQKEVIKTQVLEQPPPPPKLLPKPEASGSTKDLNPDADLFFVHYPMRPSNDISKNKVKATKRLDSSSPTIVIPAKRIKSDHKERRTRRKSSHKLKTTSGRDYRAYLHKCLEAQTQNRVVSIADFKVDKLFQPEQGIVTLGGETLSLPIDTQHQFYEATLPISEPAVVFTNSTENIISSVPGPIACQGLLVEPAKEGENIVESEKVDQEIPTTSAPHNPSTEVSNNKDCEAEEQVPGPSEEGLAEKSDNLSTYNSLPDKFTVTSDTTNEFDLLIQNVVHEELVDDNGETLSHECFAKKMKISNNNSNNSSRICSQEGVINMDEAGKPRCTYTELIEKALTETGGLTVSEIYSWISERYPFYKPDDDRWKNSVRHNLSINPYFKKGEKARSGAGHLWTISEESKGLRPSMVSWDEVSLEQDRRKSPYDPSEFSMPMESETDRAVADILGRYVSECRANQEASKDDKKETSSARKCVKNDKPDQSDKNDQDCSLNTPPIELSFQQEPTTTLPVEQQPEYNPSGALCDNEGLSSQFNLSELNSAQFTVDLSGITIPEGGSINFEDLVNNGRLIYIQTDPEANKENETAPAVILDESLLPELAGLSNVSSVPQNDEDRYQSFYSESLNLDLGFGKSDSISNVTFSQDDILAAACAQLISEDTTTQEHQQDLTSLDHNIPLSAYDASTSSNGDMESGFSASLPSINAAALYESKELGISYTYQSEINEHDLLQ